jgi:hypothetical protein
MKLQPTALAAALALAVGSVAVAGDKPTGAPPAQETTHSTATPVQGTEPVETTSSATHGSTVSTYARTQAERVRQGDKPPSEPPGQSTSYVAQGQRDFKGYDTDGDGILSASELEADTTLSANLQTYDTDGDGRLSRAEWDAYRVASADGDLPDYDDED